jgi:hypothetical protein
VSTALAVAVLLFKAYVAGGLVVRVGLMTERAELGIGVIGIMLKDSQGGFDVLLSALGARLHSLTVNDEHIKIAYTRAPRTYLLTLRQLLG